MFNSLQGQALLATLSLELFFQIQIKNIIVIFTFREIKNVSTMWSSSQDLALRSRQSPGSIPGMGIILARQGKKYAIREISKTIAIIY